MEIQTIRVLTTERDKPGPGVAFEFFDRVGDLIPFEDIPAMPWTDFERLDPTDAHVKRMRQAYWRENGSTPEEDAVKSARFTGLFMSAIMLVAGVAIGYLL